MSARPSDRPILGLWLRVGSILAFSGMALCVKLSADDFPTGQTVFYRSFFAMIPLVGYLWLTGEFPNGLRTSQPFGHLLRCLAGCLAMFSAFASLHYLPLADCTLIGFPQPAIRTDGRSDVNAVLMSAPDESIGDLPQVWQSSSRPTVAVPYQCGQRCALPGCRA